MDLKVKYSVIDGAPGQAVTPTKHTLGPRSLPELEPWRANATHECTWYMFEICLYAHSGHRRLYNYCRNPPSANTTRISLLILLDTPATSSINNQGPPLMNNSTRFEEHSLHMLFLPLEECG